MSVSYGWKNAHPVTRGGGAKALLVLCVGYSLLAGLYPYEWSDAGALWNLRLTANPEKLLDLLARQFGLIDFLRNVVYFIPWGVIAYLTLSNEETPRRKIFFTAALAGGAVSLTIEFAQIFFTRAPSVFDVLANTLGAVLGAAICVFSPVDPRSTAARLIVAVQGSRALLVIVPVFAAIPLIKTLTMPEWFGFRNWDSRFTLQLANEATMNRPWLGTLYLAAIYNRVLSADQIARLYETGLSPKPAAERSDKGLIALYGFAEGHGAAVRDISGYGEPLDLVLEPPSRFRWVTDGTGIQVLRRAILKSPEPARKLYDALTASSEMSVEIWAMPSRTIQRGPARMVSFSRDTSHRNFTLGQAGADYEFRLRTPASGVNGTPLSLKTHDSSIRLERAHVVVTYKGSVERLYINGRKHPHELNLTQSAIVSFGAPRSTIGRIAYVLVCVFPVGLLYAFFLSGNGAAPKRAFAVSAVMALAIAGCGEIIEANLFPRPLDIAVMTYALIAAPVGAFIGMRFAASVPSLSACDPSVTG